jgi:thiol-disulfide isomerase/thioredoxin
MDRIYLMGGGLALAGGLLLARGIRILWRGEATLADALPVFGLLGRLFLGGFRLKGGWARAASLPIFLLSLIAFLGGGSLIALNYFRPQELEGVMLSAAAKMGKENPAESQPEAVASDTLGQMKDLLTGLRQSSQERADAAVTVPETDLGPIPISHPGEKDFQKFITTPGKLSVVVLEVPSDETSVKLREMMERVGRRFSNVAQVALIDLETWPELGESQGVSQIPDVRFYRDGKKVDGFLGVPVKDVVLLEKFTRHSQGLTPDIAASHSTPEALGGAAGKPSPPPPAATRSATPTPRALAEWEFDTFIRQPGCLSVVVYGADWCPYSRKMAGFLNILGPEFGEVAEIGRVDIMRVSEKFADTRNSNGVVVVDFYRDGKLLMHQKGCPEIEALRRQFARHTADLCEQRAAAAKIPRTSDEPAMQPMKKGWMPAGMEKR